MAPRRPARRPGGRRAGGTAGGIGRRRPPARPIGPLPGDRAAARRRWRASGWRSWKRGSAADGPVRPPPTVRVDCGALRRVVWDGDSQPPPGAGHAAIPRRPPTPLPRLPLGQRRPGSSSPKTAFAQVPFAELAELRLPHCDPWDCYYNELARLVPDGSGRLVRIQTDEGLLATVSPNWWHPAGAGGDQDSSSWWHVVQPAWSLDPLCVRFATVRVLSSFAPTRCRCRGSSLPASCSTPSWCKGATGRRTATCRADRWATPPGSSPGASASTPPATSGSICRTACRPSARRSGWTGSRAKAAAPGRVICCNDPTAPPLYRSQHLIGSAERPIAACCRWAGPPPGRNRWSWWPMPRRTTARRGPIPWTSATCSTGWSRCCCWTRRRLKAEIDKRQRLPHARLGGLDGKRGGRPAACDRGSSGTRAIPTTSDFVVTVVQRPTAPGAHAATRPCRRATARWKSSCGESSATCRPARLEVRIDGRPMARTEVPLGADPPRFSLPLERYRGARRSWNWSIFPADARDQVAVADAGDDADPLGPLAAGAGPLRRRERRWRTKGDGSFLVTRPAPDGRRLRADRARPNCPDHGAAVGGPARPLVAGRRPGHVAARRIPALAIPGRPRARPAPRPTPAASDSPIPRWPTPRAMMLLLPAGRRPQAPPRGVARWPATPALPAAR